VAFAAAPVRVPKAPPPELGYIPKGWFTKATPSEMLRINPQEPHVGTPLMKYPPGIAPAGMVHVGPPPPLPVKAMPTAAPARMAQVAPPPSAAIPEGKPPPRGLVAPEIASLGGLPQPHMLDVQVTIQNVPKAIPRAPAPLLQNEPVSPRQLMGYMVPVGRLAPLRDLGPETMVYTTSLVEFGEVLSCMFRHLTASTLEPDPFAPNQLPSTPVTIAALTPTSQPSFSGSPIAMAAADNAMLCQQMLAGYMAEARAFVQQAGGFRLRIPRNLSLQEPLTGKALVQSPGHVGLGGVPQYPAIAVSTTAGFGCITTYLKPTVVQREARSPMGQAFSSRWLLTVPLAQAIETRTWGIDPGMADLFAINQTLVLAIFPVLTSGPEGSLGDLKLPLPPPGVLKVPISVLPVYWNADEACETAKDFLRVRLRRDTRGAARVAQRISFQIVTIEGPDQSDTLMLKRCPTLETVRALQDFLSRQCALQEPMGTSVLHLLPTVHAM
jgi:hypothetical protein